MDNEDENGGHGYIDGVRSYTIRFDDKAIPNDDPDFIRLQQVVHANHQNKQPRVKRLRAHVKMQKMKQLNEFAQSRGYRDWIEFKAYEEPETVQEARKMIERGY